MNYASLSGSHYGVIDPSCSLLWANHRLEANTDL